MCRRAICRVSNGQDFFALSALKCLRGAADWLLGGPIFRRRRHRPDELRVGDMVDAWRVIGWQSGRKLTLLLKMKLPGTGVLDFEIVPQGTLQQVRAKVYFHAAGIWGLLYGYPLVPFHLWIFRAMTSEIARRAQSG